MPTTQHTFIKTKKRHALLLLLAFALSGCVYNSPSILIPKSPPPLAMPKNPPEVALVLGSGGARGYAHVGVISVLRKAGVPINMIAGASVGSVVGALYADQTDIKQVYRHMMNAGFWTFADISVVPHLSGVMTGSHLEEFILKSVHARNFSQLKIPLIIATTDLYNGSTYVIRSGPLAPAVKASSTIPGIVVPSTIYGRTLVDGGITDPVPVNLAKRYKPKLIIAVDIDKQLKKTIPWTGVNIMQRSLEIMGMKVSKLTAKNADVIITPKLGQASAFTVDDAKSLYRKGEKAAHKALPRILRLMKQRGIKPVFD